MQLSILFFLLYIAVVVVIGWVASRKETEEGFMIADRNVAGLPLAATMSAGFFDGATLSIYLAYIYQFGLSAIWLFIGLGLGFFALRRFATRIKQKADALHVYTMPEYFLHTIGNRSGHWFPVFPRSSRWGSKNSAWCCCMLSVCPRRIRSRLLFRRFSRGIFDTTRIASVRHPCGR